jgi:hypothetical protein
VHSVRQITPALKAIERQLKNSFMCISNTLNRFLRFRAIIANPQTGVESDIQTAITLCQQFLIDPKYPIKGHDSILKLEGCRTQLKEVQDLIKKLSKDELTQQKQLFQKRKEIRENLLALYESFNMWLNQMDLKKMSDTYQHNINLVNNLLKNKNLVDGMQVDLREIVTDVMKKMEELA